MRKRPIKKYSGSWTIKLIPQDMEDLNLKEGDVVDIDDIIKISGKPKTSKKQKEKNGKNK